MIDTFRHKWLWLALCCVVAACPAQVIGQTDAGGSDQTARAAPTRDGQHDFDFEFGAWDVRLSRLLEPLTGSTRWAEYQGTSVVRKVWDGRANLGELNVNGATGPIRGLSLRLYNPETRQWNISWANSNDGIIGPPMVGGFDVDGRGEFYNQETFNGRAIFVRFIFSDITETSFALEQAFSPDGGTTWEANWIARFVRQLPAADSITDS
jgi:hypothetical protein